VQRCGQITRRGFVKKVASMVIGAALSRDAGCYLADSLVDNGQTVERIVNRQSVAQRLRKGIRKLLGELEAKTGLTVKFRALERKWPVVAQYSFEQPDGPIVMLRADWEDVDVAHELMHMRMELVDGYAVLAWRKNVRRDTSVEKAFGLIRSYVDDAVVFERLLRMGLALDGEVIKHQFFNDVCTKVPKYLTQGRSPKNDGMAHFDSFAEGRYGDLRRSAFLVQAELVLRRYGDKLSDEHKSSVKEFICAFRQFRQQQAAKADKALAYFEKYDVQSLDGHRKILSSWAELEELKGWVGLSSYVRVADGFVLPFPDERDVKKQGASAQSVVGD
jgi:hypothetical protein